jgi:hypothetical protein
MNHLLLQAPSRVGYDSGDLFRMGFVLIRRPRNVAGERETL